MDVKKNLSNTSENEKFFTAVDAGEEQGEEVKCFVLLLRL
jgi:hypothetical protein